MPAAPQPKPRARNHSGFAAVAAEHLAPAPGNLFAGTSGWAYPSWKPGFYPAEVPSRAFLHFYAARLTAVEVNYTFRTLPSATQLQGWIDATPPGFRFSFKAPQRITHFQRLRLEPGKPKSPGKTSSRKQVETVAGRDSLGPADGHGILGAFLAAVEPARAAGRLGPLLFQLPPNFAADTERLAAFLDNPLLAASPLQLAFEFRHASWFSDATYEILRAHKAALCIAESDDLATPDVATADFRCYRLRRNGGYGAAELETLARRFTALARHGEVYSFFKHEDEPTGARNAVAMLQQAARLHSADPDRMGAVA